MLALDVENAYRLLYERHVSRAGHHYYGIGPLVRYRREPEKLGASRNVAVGVGLEGFFPGRLAAAGIEYLHELEHDARRVGVLHLHELYLLVVIEALHHLGHLVHVVLAVDYHERVGRLVRLQGAVLAHHGTQDLGKSLGLNASELDEPHHVLVGGFPGILVQPQRKGLGLYALFADYLVHPVYTDDGIAVHVEEYFEEAKRVFPGEAFLGGDYDDLLVLYLLAQEIDLRGYLAYRLHHVLERHAGLEIHYAAVPGGRGRLRLLLPLAGRRFGKRRHLGRRSLGGHGVGQGFGKFGAAGVLRRGLGRGSGSLLSADVGNGRYEKRDRERQENAVKKVSHEILQIREQPDLSVRKPLVNRVPVAASFSSPGEIDGELVVMPELVEKQQRVLHVV